MTAIPTTKSESRRPWGITALSVFFLVGAAISLIAAISLLLPNSFLKAMWRINPRAHENLTRLGFWAVILMLTVSMFCAAASLGLWWASRWGYWLAVGLITVNLIGDVTNVLLGTEPRAIVGVPVAAAILAYLMSRKVRKLFNSFPQN